MKQKLPNNYDLSVCKKDVCIHAKKDLAAIIALAIAAAIIMYGASLLNKANA